jgi:hypothetical protein
MSDAFTGIRNHIGRGASLLLFLIGAASAYPQTIASDFEIQRMTKQAAAATEFLPRMQAHLNLGDLHRSRSETAIATRQYRNALEIADGERIDARGRGDLRGYVLGTAYTGLASAKLGHRALAFTFLEEATRYDRDTASTWNIYAISMNELDLPAKAAAAAENAVTIATARAKKTPTVAELLDISIYRYTLSNALAVQNRTADARTHLEAIVQTLRSPRFDGVRRDVARQEAFEIYFVTASDAATYVSLLNRAQFRLADLYEEAGEPARAIALYDAVLADRLDDPNALAARARLSSGEDRERGYADALDANPFAMPVVREYQQWLAGREPAAIGNATSPGAKVRSALVRIERGETRLAREELKALVAQYPGNQTLAVLLAETEADAAPKSDALPGASPSAAELRSLIALFEANRLTTDQRVALDSASYTSTVLFDASIAAPAGQTAFETGTIDGVRIRFGEPTAFTGAFAAGVPLRLTYRILGATDVGGTAALLVEPLGLVKP